MSARHPTVWEDDRKARVWCPVSQKEGGVLDADEPPSVCPGCGATLKLHWNVYVSVVDPSTPQSGEPKP